MQERVEPPGPVTLVGVRVQLVLLLARLTTPAKPFRADTVTVDVLGEPALTVAVVGLTERAKSGVLTAPSCRVTEEVGRLLLEPSTITLNDPG